MKKINLSFLAFGLFINSFAQDGSKKLPSLGIHFLLDDFKTAAAIKSEGLSSVISSNSWSKTGQMNPGLALSYMDGLSDFLDLAATASGSFVDYPVPGKTSFGDSKLLLDVTAVVNLKLLTDRHTVSPYLSLGAGASKWGGYYGAFIPTGAGLQFNIAHDGFLLINSQYRIPVTENVASHLYYSIGFAGSIGKKKVAEPASLPPPPSN